MKPIFAHITFNIKDRDLDRFHKAYVGVVSEAGMTYNNQERMHMKWVFTIKVTLLGANLCLLEEAGEG